MRLLLIFVMVVMVDSFDIFGCEDDIKDKLEAFVKDKDLKSVFNAYATTGLMDSDQMKKLLEDASVKFICRSWPSKVIEKFDKIKKDNMLSWEEICLEFKNQDIHDENLQCQ